VDLNTEDDTGLPWAFAQRRPRFRDRSQAGATSLTDSADHPISGALHRHTSGIPENDDIPAIPERPDRSTEASLGQFVEPGHRAGHIFRFELL
jgi:hypothetical protein